MIPENRLSTSTVKSEYLSPDGDRKSMRIDYEYGGIHLRDPSKGLFYQKWVFEIYDKKVLISAPNYIRAELFEYSSPIKEISGTFDQNMNPCVAFRDSLDINWLYWFDTAQNSQVFSRLDTDFGADPGVRSVRVCLDDKRQSQAGTSDIILSYVVNKTLCFRMQRDRFLIKYILAYRVNATILDVGMNKGNRLQFKMRYTGLTIEDIAPPIDPLFPTIPPTDPNIPPPSPGQPLPPVIPPVIPPEPPPEPPENPPGGFVPIQPLNPGFEDGVTHWTKGIERPVLASNWSIATGAAAHSGNKCLRWEGDSTPPDGGVLESRIYVNDTKADSPGQDYFQFKVYARCKRSAIALVGLVRARVGVYKYNAAGVEVSVTMGSTAVSLFGNSLDSGYTEIGGFAAKEVGVAYFKVLVEAQGPAGTTIDFDSLAWNGTEYIP